jgi:hypothetical protein
MQGAHASGTRHMRDQVRKDNWPQRGKQLEQLTGIPGKARRRSSSVPDILMLPQHALKNTSLSCPDLGTGPWRSVHPHAVGSLACLARECTTSQDQKTLYSTSRTSDSHAATCNIGDPWLHMSFKGSSHAPLRAVFRTPGRNSTRVYVKRNTAKDCMPLIRDRYGHFKPGLSLYLGRGREAQAVVGEVVFLARQAWIQECPGQHWPSFVAEMSQPANPKSPSAD